MRKITKIKRSIRAISPVISVLLMIAIAVVASLVAYAWVMGYMSFQGDKIGKAVQIQSAAFSDDHLVVYVQNVGQGTVQMNYRDNTVFVNDKPRDILEIGGVNPPSMLNGHLISVLEGQTVGLTVEYHYNVADEPLRIKIVTLDGTTAQGAGPKPTPAPTTAPAQYTLTVTPPTGGSVTKSPDQATYTSGDPVQLTATAQDGWSFSAWGGALSGSTNPTSITMNADKTVTATFTQDVEPPPASYILTVNSAYGTHGGTGSYTSGTAAQATVTPLTVSDTVNPANIQYAFTQWSGDASGTTSPSNAITMNGAKTATANWKTQYRIQFAASPTAGGTPTATAWFDSAATNVPITTTVTPGYTFNGWTATAGCATFAAASSVSTTITVNGAGIITANFIAPVPKYQVTFGSAGLNGADATGNLVSYSVSGGGPSGTISVAGDSIMVDEGATVSYTFVGTVTSSINGKQYTFESVTGSPSGFTVTGTTTVTGNYQTQYYLTVTSDQGTPSGQDWYDSGLTATAGLNVGTVAGGDGVQYVFTSWGTDASGNGYAQSNDIVMNGPKTATANWQTQYYLTMSTNFGTASPSGWYIAGSTVTISATAPIVGSGEQYVWNGWTGTGTGSYTGTNNPATDAVTMNAPITETASWTHQYQVIFGSTGLGVDATATDDLVSFTVTGGSYSGATSPIKVAGGSIMVDEGATVSYTFVGTVTSSIDGKRYAIDGVSTGSVTSAAIVTRNYQTEYKLTTSTHGTGTISLSLNPTGGWYTSGYVVTLTASSNFRGWTGDLSGTTNPAQLTMNGPKNVMATFGSSRTNIVNDDMNDWSGSTWTHSYVDINQNLNHDHYGARLHGEDNSNDGTMTVQFSTTGKYAIQLSYWLDSESLGSGEYLQVQWRVGTTDAWIPLDQSSANEVVRILYLPESAANKAIIQINFTVVAHHENHNALVDDVLVTGVTPS